MWRLSVEDDGEDQLEITVSMYEKVKRTQKCKCLGVPTVTTDMQEANARIIAFQSQIGLLALPWTIQGKRADASASTTRVKDNQHFTLLDVTMHRWK